MIMSPDWTKQKITTDKIIFALNILSFLEALVTGADPGFLERGFI